MPTAASQVRFASTAAVKTRNFGQKPNRGGTPARLNIKTAKAAASAGLVRERPEREASVSTGRPLASRISRPPGKAPGYMAIKRGCKKIKKQDRQRRGQW